MALVYSCFPGQSYAPVHNVTLVYNDSPVPDSALACNLVPVLVCNVAPVLVPAPVCNVVPGLVPAPACNVAPVLVPTPVCNVAPGLVPAPACNVVPGLVLALVYVVYNMPLVLAPAYHLLLFLQKKPSHHPVQLPAPFPPEMHLCRNRKLLLDLVLALHLAMGTPEASQNPPQQVFPPDQSSLPSANPSCPLP